jgi:hypothetical protein
MIQLSIQAQAFGSLVLLVTAGVVAIWALRQAIINSQSEIRSYYDDVKQRNERT